MTLGVNDILNRRGDLSTFLVHLTRTTQTPASENLKSIIKQRKIIASSVFGHLKSTLEAAGKTLESQKSVCFTETPLEYTHLLVEQIADRDFKFEPYGIALTKRICRERGVNPVWYVDISPGHDWLTENLNRIAKRLEDGGFKDTDIEKLFPYFEHMGNGPKRGGAGGYRKEFWWEREWRHVGNFGLPSTVICLCPESEIPAFQELMAAVNLKGSCIDPRWSLEKIIAHLAGFSASEIDVLRNV